MTALAPASTAASTQAPKPAVLVVARIITEGFMRDDMRFLGEIARPLSLELARAPRRGRLGRIGWAYATFVRTLLRERVRVVVFWFASSTYTPGMSLLARLLRRRVIIITGGIDAVYVPSIDWGALKSRWSRLAFGVSMRLADVVLPFSAAAASTVREYGRPRRMRMLYPAVDVERFADSSTPREPRAVTCCYAYDANNIVQKGLDGFVAAARRMPDVRFVLVGEPADDAARRFAASVPPNVELRGRIARREDYAEMLATNAAYLQLSAHEGFGVSVAEAMAAGAIPVVSDRFSLPEVVGTTGEVIPYGDVDATVTAIRRALAADAAARQRARARAAQFDPSLRRAGLEEELRRLV